MVDGVGLKQTLFLWVELETDLFVVRWTVYFWNSFLNFITRSSHLFSLLPISPLLLHFSQGHSFFYPFTLMRGVLKLITDTDIYTVLLSAGVWNYLLLGFRFKTKALKKSHPLCFTIPWHIITLYPLTSNTSTKEALTQLCWDSKVPFMFTASVLNVKLLTVSKHWDSWYPHVKLNPKLHKALIPSK